VAGRADGLYWTVLILSVPWVVVVVVVVQGVDRHSGRAWHGQCLQCSLANCLLQLPCLVLVADGPCGGLLCVCITLQLLDQGEAETCGMQTREACSRKEAVLDSNREMLWAWVSQRWAR